MKKNGDRCFIFGMHCEILTGQLSIVILFNAECIIIISALENYHDYHDYVRRWSDHHTCTQSNSDRADCVVNFVKKYLSLFMIYFLLL